MRFATTIVIIHEDESAEAAQKRADAIVQSTRNRLTAPEVIHVSLYSVQVKKV